MVGNIRHEVGGGFQCATEVSVCVHDEFCGIGWKQDMQHQNKSTTGGSAVCDVMM